MSSIISGGDLTVFYLDEDRRKQIKWTGGTLKSNTQIMIDVYDDTEDLMSLPAQSNDGLIFDAPTPGEFIIGKIDAGELDPWFIDLRTVEHLIGNNGSFTGCAIRTSGWARVQDSNTGIVVVPITNINIVDADIGKTISHADGDSGTLLDFYDNGTNEYLWIRPDTDAVGNNWDSTSGTITVLGGTTATQTAAAHTGEMVWGNVFTSGAIVADTHIYISQDGAKLVAYNQTDNDWWVDGHLDRAIPIKDWTTAAFPTIDLGYLTVKANQYGTKYFPIVIRMNTTSGGNVSAGLTSGNDITNNTGYSSITVGGGSGTFTVGDEISGDVSGARAKITQIDSPGATATYHYYLVGDPLTDFNGSEAITNEDDTGAATSSGAPTAQGPALSTWYDGNALPTVTFTNTQVDIDDDGTTEEYAIPWDVNQASLAQLAEYFKYVARRGSTFSLDGIDGEQWIGLDFAINYATITGTVSEGAIVTGLTSLATATVVSNPGGASNTAMVRNTRGTFIDGEVIEVDGSNRFDATGLTVSVIVPVAENSFGVLAGTTLFLTRGVVITDYKAAEENLWSTIDATGVVKSRPATITVSMLNLLQYDWATWFRLTGVGGSIDKTEYSATGGETFASTTLTVDGTIAADVPNKTNGGRLFLRDADDNGTEYVLRFSSFVPSTGVVTLAQVVVALADAGTNTTTVVEAGAFTAANVEVGDLVYNNTVGAVSYVSERVDDNTITIFPAIAGQTTADVITTNAIPGITVNTLDDVAFAILHAFRETAGDESASMVYVADIFSLARLRNTSLAAIKIKGASQAVTIGTGGGQSSPPRIPNTVYGS
mgnify:CR=1 FL=1|tara:strand:+ start:921 stop:3398 length:2478 start_codon:yes stop_codon:yes gene_type:complete